MGVEFVFVVVKDISHQRVGSERRSASNVRGWGTWPRCAVSRNENPPPPPPPPPPSTRYVQDVSQVVSLNENALEVEGVDGEMADLGLYSINSKGKSGYQVQLLLEGKQVTMEVDAGSAVSIISETEYNNLFKNLPLQPTTLQFRTYSG